MEKLTEKSMRDLTLRKNSTADNSEAPASKYSLPERTALITERLHLRRAQRGDAKTLFSNYTSDVDCSHFLQRKPHSTVSQTDSMLQKFCDEAWNVSGTPFSWVIAKRETDEPIGLFLAFPDGHKTDFHYGIGKRFWGQGLASEAGKATLEALWKSPNTQRIWTFCDPENIGSKRVLEKLGLTHEGILRKWAVLPAFGPEARDCHVFGATRVKE
ncbi:GNAT family N-acetyltransferase [Trinickia fusca]|uniref:N-acetyltransferase n=1 Tax=Trinickia fusca TaxID=2419777 RepID=A0A494XE26_9BURK|nr:GNAT family N-acetyltransferase [Trinickia fusca]RKP48132.1 N-acetyltransferase [Trinickia fusca]